jgi:hypothetical protein
VLEGFSDEFAGWSGERNPRVFQKEMVYIYNRSKPYLTEFRNFEKDLLRFKTPIYHYYYYYYEYYKDYFFFKFVLYSSIFLGCFDPNFPSALAAAIA